MGAFAKSKTPGDIGPGFPNQAINRGLCGVGIALDEFWFRAFGWGADFNLSRLFRFWQLADEFHSKQAISKLCTSHDDMISEF